MIICAGAILADIEAHASCHSRGAFRGRGYVAPPAFASPETATIAVVYPDRQKLLVKDGERLQSDGALKIVYFGAEKDREAHFRLHLRCAKLDTWASTGIGRIKPGGLKRQGLSYGIAYNLTIVFTCSVC